MNDRSPFILGLKFLAVVLFVCTVTWVVRVVANDGAAPVMQELTLPARVTPAFASQFDTQL